MNNIFFLAFFLLIFLVTPSHQIFAETLEEQKIGQEIAKLVAETKKLDLEINVLENPPTSIEPTEFQQGLITSVITIVGSVIGISVTAGYTWYKSKMIVPLSDQEKLFRDYVKKDLSSQYKKHWDVIRNDVLTNNPRLDYYWGIISNRDFPEDMDSAIKTTHFENIKKYIQLYNIGHLKQKFQESDTVYKTRITDLANSLTKSVNSDYFEIVATTLPKLITVAVITSKPSSQELNEDPEIWNKNSLKKLKWLMILNGISEYEKTVEFLISAEIENQLKNKSTHVQYAELLTISLKDLLSRNIIDQDIFNKILKIVEK